MIYRQTRIKNNLLLRGRMMHTVRQFFVDHGYMEIETPIRIPAPAPEEHIDAEASGDWFLHTSPELCMKRLLAADYERIFQICKCFRAGERGRRHLPEMTLLEWYTAGADYGHMMEQCEALIRHVILELKGTGTLVYQGRSIEIAGEIAGETAGEAAGEAAGPWPRLTVAAAFDRYGSLSAEEALRCGRFDEIMGLEIEPHLGMNRPVFLMDYPAPCGALARLKIGQPDVAERFELYIGGLELCNGFSELTDPLEQRRRFTVEGNSRRMAGKRPYPMPEPFLQALEKMPASTGNALGIDRLAMLLADASDIKEVVAFSPEEL